MSQLTDYFVAPSDEAAAGVLRSGRLKKSGFPVLETNNMDPTIVMGNLEAILTGRDYREVCANPRQSFTPAFTEGVMVVALTDELRDALAASDESRLREAGVALAATEEVAPLSEEAVEGFVGCILELAALARTARARGESMYCRWV